VALHVGLCHYVAAFFRTTGVDTETVNKTNQMGYKVMSFTQYDLCTQYSSSVTRIELVCCIKYDKVRVM